MKIHVFRHYRRYLTIPLNWPSPIHLNHLWCCIWYHCITDHQSIWVDITYSVFSCLVQDIRCRVHHLVMAESKMVTIATTRFFFAIAPFMKMFRDPYCISVPSFMLLWNSEHHFHITPGTLWKSANFSTCNGHQFKMATKQTPWDISWPWQHEKLLTRHY